MNDNNLWAILWTLAATVVITIVSASVLSSMHARKLMSEARDPLEWACADSGSDRTHPSCMVLMARAKQ